MKKAIAFIFMVWLLSGCEHLMDIQIGNMYYGQNLYNPGFPEMQTLRDVARYVESVLDYDYTMDPDNPIVDPQMAIETGKGNCSTYSMLFINVAYFTLGIKCNLAIVDCRGSYQRSIGTGGLYVNHACVMIDGQLYSAYFGTIITDYEASYYYDFDEVFN